MERKCKAQSQCSEVSEISSCLSWESLKGMVSVVCVMRASLGQEMAFMVIVSFNASLQH